VPFHPVESQPAEYSGLRAKAAWLPTGSGRSGARNLCGTATWFCFNYSPRGCGWSSSSGHSWSLPGLIGRPLGWRVGAGRGGAEGWRKCLLSQVTRGADAATHGGSWAPGQRVGGLSCSPCSSLVQPLLLPTLVSAGEPSDHSPNQRAHPALSQEVGSAPLTCLCNLTAFQSSR
jgi:hypothetical protein